MGVMIGLKLCFYNFQDRNTDLARAVEVIMAQEMRIYIFMAK